MECVINNSKVVIQFCKKGKEKEMQFYYQNLILKYILNNSKDFMQTFQSY